MTDISVDTSSSIKFLQERNVFDTFKKCPGPSIRNKRHNYCGCDMILKTASDRKDGVMWRCRKKHTVTDGDKKYVVKDVKLSIRHNSWLYEAKLTLGIILELIYLWSNGFTASEICHELKLSSKTVIEWTCYFREAVTTHIMENSEKIGGNGVEVEIDESKFGKRKYYKGHRVTGQWVFGGREKYDKTKVFMVAVPNRKRCTLLPIIKRWISKGSIIHSDCWKAYDSLSKEGYTHVKVNHSKEFIDRRTYACTNSIESDWRHCKVMLPKYGVHIGQHYTYLGEFMWRRRNSAEDKFLKLIEVLNFNFTNNLQIHCPNLL